MGFVNLIHTVFDQMRSTSRPVMNNKKTRGQMGEEIACNALEKEGYRILVKNFSCKQGELDIIAEHKGVICFVEVNY